MFPVLLQLYLAIWCASGKIAAANREDMNEICGSENHGSEGF